MTPTPLRPAPRAAQAPTRQRHRTRRQRKALRRPARRPRSATPPRNRPLAPRHRQEGVAQVGFAVDRSGHASDVRLVQGSGYETPDAEALATVQRAAPLPAPPAEVPGDPVQVIVPMDFVLR